MSFLDTIQDLAHPEKDNYKRSFRITSLTRPHLSLYRKKIRLKRMSSFLLFSMKGSVTVEASVAIPLFLFAILNLLSLILTFGGFSANMASMQQKAKELSVHAHILGENQSEMIQLREEYVIAPIIEIVGFPKSYTLVGCSARKWIGYDVIHNYETEKLEEWVYITDSGEVYHRKRNCSYINPSIHCTDVKSIFLMRNREGKKYSLCEVCGEGYLTGVCFYTNYGERYHTSLHCSSMKRSVKRIPLSKVGNRRVCSKCGGE